MPVASRANLKEYCLRRLGKPVIQINVDDTQLEDRIDEALEYYQDYHHDATQHAYRVHTVTATDITNGYITLPESVIRVVNVLPLDSQSSESLFDPEYQIMMSDLQILGSMDTVSYTLTKQHMNLLKDMFRKGRRAEYDRHTDRLRLSVDWANFTADESKVIMEVYETLDPEAFTDVYNDRWLKKYLTALFKRQWGENMKKMSGIQLPGGVTLNGKELFDEAMEEIEKIETEMLDGFSDPIDFMVG